MIYDFTCLAFKLSTKYYNFVISRIIETIIFLYTVVPVKSKHKFSNLFFHNSMVQWEMTHLLVQLGQSSWFGTHLPLNNGTGGVTSEQLMVQVRVDQFISIPGTQIDPSFDWKRPLFWRVFQPQTRGHSQVPGTHHRKFKTNNSRVMNQTSLKHRSRTATLMYCWTV